MKAYALTDIGKTRKVNQDAQFASTEPVGELSNLFVVARSLTQLLRTEWAVIRREILLRAI